MTDDPLSIARSLGAVFDRIGISWAVGGSMASSVHGLPRTTQDLDLVAALTPNAGMTLATEAVGFSVDGESLRDAIRAGRSYNVFHEATMTKVDLFPAVGRFERNQLTRARKFSGIPIVAAEDSILAKLRWFRLGEEVSERQWRDVLGVMDVQRGRLDEAHLDQWAAELGIVDLLARARAESARI